jgi:hypothetical protein
MLTKEQIIKRLQATRKPKLTPPKPTATQRAEERFSEARKPTVALVQDAAAHNRALRERLRREREAKPLPELRYQRLYDMAWQRTVDALEAQEELYASTCHVGPGDSDWSGR